VIETTNVLYALQSITKEMYDVAAAHGGVEVGPGRSRPFRLLFGRGPGAVPLKGYGYSLFGHSF